MSGPLNLMDTYCVFLNISTQLTVTVALTALTQLFYFIFYSQTSLTCTHEWIVSGDICHALR